MLMMLQASLSLPPWVHWSWISKIIVRVGWAKLLNPTYTLLLFQVKKHQEMHIRPGHDPHEEELQIV